MIKGFKYILVLVLFLSLAVSAIAKEYTISGTAPNSEGKQLTVFTYEEYFTMKMVEEESVFIKADGSFSIQVDAEENSLVVLRIESINSQIHLGAQKSYNVIFDISEASRPIKFSNTNWCSVDFVNLPESDVNYRLEKLNKLHSEFYKENSGAIYQVLTSPNSHVRDEINAKGLKLDMAKREESYQVVSDSSSLTDEFINDFKKMLISNDFDTAKEDYVSISALYMQAELESLLGVNENVLFENYLKNRSYRSNGEYLNFYKSYYRNILEKVYQSEGKNKYVKYLYDLHLDSALMAIAPEFLDTNGMEDLEMAMLSGIEAGLELPSISSRDVTLLLELLSRKGSNKIQLLSKNYKDELSKGRKGYKPEGFKLLDLDERLHELDEFKGQFIYLSFFASWNVESAGHQERIKKLESSYGNRVTFISVCMDYEWDNFKEFLAVHRDYNWQFLFGNTDKLLKEKFNLSTVPEYILLDPNGAFLMDSTPSPEGNVSQLLDNILRH